MTPQEISVALAILTAIASLAAAVAAWLSDRATKRATEAQLFSIFFTEYGNSEMLLSLRQLRQVGDQVAAKMTPAQIAEARRLAREWQPMSQR